MKKAGLYIHIPFCIRKCSYCDFFSLKHSDYKNILSGGKGSLFADRIVKDVFWAAEKFGIDEWDTIYVGGGTPSILSLTDIDFIFSSILKKQKTLPVEFTMEVNPEDVTPEFLKVAAASGVNRLSVGVQTFSDTSLRMVNRRGCSQKTLAALDLIKSYNKFLLSCDLIAGLQNQNKNILIDDISTLLKFNPEHISFYSLCSEKKLSCCEEDRITDLWICGKQKLVSQNYIQYEVSNFSYNNLYQCLHNKKYWRLEDYIGIGPGAVGSLFYMPEKKRLAQSFRFYVCKDITAWMNFKNREDMYSSEIISEQDCIKEFFMMQLRLNEGLDRKKFYLCFKKDILDLCENTILKWQRSGKLILTEDVVSMTESGLFFLNSFLEQIFEELDMFFSK